MNWKSQLKYLEDHKQWDTAIEFMQKIIKECPDDLTAALYMNFLLINLLVEEDYNEQKHDYYATLIKKYFHESYEKFSNNPEYLYYTGRIAFMSEWYFDISKEQAENMIFTAMNMEPNNLIYQWAYYSSNHEKDYKNPQEAIKYAQNVLDPNSEIQQILKTKGSLGEYVLDVMTGWAQRLMISYNINTNQIYH